MSSLEYPPLPGLAKLLARSTREVVSVTGFEETLCHLAGVLQVEGDLPIAALTLLGDGGHPGHGWWLRADPVYLRPDQGKLLLFPGRSLHITEAEFKQWKTDLQATFAEWGFEWIALAPDRWYLGLPENPRIKTTGLSSVMGQDIAGALPQGLGAKTWRVRFNEMQMVLHASQINQRREKQNQPTLNSLWFWAAGVLPDVATDWQYLWTNEPLGRGLAIKANVGFSTVPANAEVLLQASAPGHCVLVLEHAAAAALDNEPEAWLTALQQLDKDWFAPLLVGLKQGRLNELNIYPCDGSKLRLTRHGLRCFWRKSQAIAQFVLAKGRS